MRVTRLIALAIFGMLPATSAVADVITFTVDPTRSSLTISGTYDGFPLFAQGGIAANLTTSYTGTIIANRDLSLDTLQITSGDIAAQNNGATSPTTSLSSNYGFTATPTIANDSLSFFGSVVFFSISVSGPPSSLSDFDMSQLSADISSGEIDYAILSGRTFSSPGSPSMTGYLAFASRLGTLSETGDVATLTLPIDTEFLIGLPLVNANGTPYPLDVHFSGTIVGTAAVPEPATLWCLGLPAALLLTHRRHGTAFTTARTSASCRRHRGKKCVIP